MHLHMHTSEGNTIATSASKQDAFAELAAQEEEQLVQVCYHTSKTKAKIDVQGAVTSCIAGAG